MIDDIDKLERMCMDILKSSGKDVDRMLLRTGPGTHRPSDQELLQFAGQMNQMYPPMPWLRPDGSTVTASAYLLALSECEGGRDVVKRIQKLTSPEVEPWS